MLNVLFFMTLLLDEVLASFFILIIVFALLKTHPIMVSFPEFSKAIPFHNFEESADLFYIILI